MDGVQRNREKAAERERDRMKSKNPSEIIQ